MLLEMQLLRGKKCKVEASMAATSPRIPTKQHTHMSARTTSPMTSQGAVTIAHASTPPSASTRSKIAAAGHLRPF